MTTETILTEERVDSLLEGVLRASGSRLANYTYQKTLDDLRSSIRAIEQAVLISPEVQALRKDAERMRAALKRISAMDSMSYHSLDSAKTTAKAAMESEE